MRVLYHDGALLPPQQERELNAYFATKEQVLRESDFVSLHVPFSDATRHLIGEAELRSMKPTAILVNTSRGPVIDEAALARALREHWIGAAGLDVFEREPEVCPALFECSNAVLAPHIASASVETRKNMSMLAAKNAVEALAGRRPPDLLNPEAWKTSASASRV
jgi:lactate dehydrogenase-like 2-hydroxyacid dehydrogenase